MGQPIQFEKDGEVITLYGNAEAKKYVAQGWKPMGDKATVATIGVDDLTKIKGVGDAIAASLVSGGYGSYKAIAEANPDKLVALDSISIRSVRGIQESAAKLATGES